MRDNVFAVVITVIGCLIIGTNARGQDNSDANQRDLVPVLDEIIVTTQKRAQSLQDVPISVSVVSGDLVDRMAAYRLEDLRSMIPNLRIDEGLASPAINVRGLGSGTSNLAFEQSVGLFVDGVYSGRSHLFESPLFDVSQVEVVRGPQGALFGKNTNAGAISITTRKPTDEFEGYLKAGYEFEREGYEFDGIVSGPLSERFKVRVAAKVQEDGGFVRNLFNSKDEPEEKGWLLRGTAVFDATDDLEIILKTEFSESRVDGGWFQMTQFGTAALSDLFRATDPNAEDRLDGVRSSVGLDPERNDTDTLATAITANWQIGDILLTSISSYGAFDYAKFVEFTGTSLAVGGTRIWEDFEQLSQELRFTLPAGRTFEYLAGLLYVDSDLFSRQITDVNQFGPFTGLSDRNYVQTDRTFSVFGSVTANVGDSWHLTAALRYSHEKKEGHAYHRTAGLVFPTWLPYSLRGSRTEKDWNPSLNVQYDVNDDVMVYGTYAQGSKAGGFLSNDSALGFRILQGTDDFEYQDESAESFELGTKMAILAGRGAVNVALFHTEFDDLQTSNFNGFFIVTANAAKARVRGVEFDTTINLSQAWTLSLAAARLDAKYTDYPDGQCLFGATQADGCDPATGTMDLSGVVLERAPKWTGSVLLGFEQPVGSALLLGAQANVTYESKSYLQPDLDPSDMVDDFSKVNARLSLGSVDGRREIALVGRNLTDKLIKNFAFDTPFFGGGAHTASIAPRRTIALEASIRF